MNKDGKILVVGSSNTDLVVKTSKLPNPGETVVGGEYFKFHGGKGANQAMAAAKLGGKVTFIGKLGDDDFGKDAIINLKSEGVSVDSILVDKESPSGIALIMVDDKGENSIAVASGANAKLTREDIKAIKPLIDSTDFILVQHEIPLESIYEILEIAALGQAKVILNPAPALPFDEAFLAKVFLLIPNEHEAEVISGVSVISKETTLLAGRKILQKGVTHVMITLGAAGVVYLSESDEFFIPSNKVKVLDTTAAGDTFCGAIAVRLSEGATMEVAISFAVEAAGISVTRMGAQISQPYRSEIKLNA